MSSSARQWSWLLLGESVRGASHKRANLPNQDSVAPLEASAAPSAVIAVADGHGSRRNFRSDRGSRIATEVGREVGHELLRRARSENSSTVKDLLWSWLTKRLVARWTEEVERDLAESPITNEEFTALEESDGPKAREAVASRGVIAYGTTLLVGVVAERWLAFAQIGDGDVLLALPNGTVVHPVPPDERLLGNETTTLSDKKAWGDFRVDARAIEADPPALVMLTTDGYRNSSADVTGFQRVATDLLDAFRSRGVGAVKEKLPTWLDEVSTMGSGDDVSIGLLIRSDIPANPLPLAGDPGVEAPIDASS